jgi:hypothetical protein
MVWVVNATPRQLYPRERPGTHSLGDGVGPRAGLGWCGKFSPLRFDPRTVQPVASRCIDYAVPDRNLFFKHLNEYL